MYGLGVINKMNNTTMRSAGFALGDKVIHAGQHHGKIVKLDFPVKHDSNKPGAIIEFDDKNLIPPQMEVPYKTIVKALPKGSGITVPPPAVYVELIVELENIDSEYNCPVCGEKWKETWHNTGIWHDCLKCNARKEDLVD